MESESERTVLPGDPAAGSLHGVRRPEEISVMCSDTNKIERVPATSMFIFMGALPRTDWLAGLVERDERSFILTGPDLIRDGQHPKRLDA